jgi:hypothetical protein
MIVFLVLEERHLLFFPSQPVGIGRANSHAIATSDASVEIDRRNTFDHDSGIQLAGQHTSLAAVAEFRIDLHIIIRNIKICRAGGSGDLFQEDTTIPATATNGLRLLRIFWLENQSCFLGIA